MPREYFLLMCAAAVVVVVTSRLVSTTAMAYLFYGDVALLGSLFLVWGVGAGVDKIRRDKAARASR